MLPIDDAAKSGDIVYVRFFGALAFQPCRYLKGVWRSEVDGRRIDVEPEGYLPPPYVEHAGAMRAAVECLLISGDFRKGCKDEKEAIKLLAATEWPGKEKTDV